MIDLYRLLRPALFGLPAETAHDASGRLLAGVPARLRSALRDRVVADPALRVRLWDIDFPNPIGMAAGFDKSARAFNTLAALGFGFVEIGTVTALPQSGNPRPRLFRLPRDQALLNRMGFNNPGAEAVARRLALGPIEAILGVNLGKSRLTPLARAQEDYLRSAELLAPHASYLVINVSSPNTPGLRDLQEAGPLRALLEAVRSVSAGRPVLLKLAPDLTDAQLDRIIEVAGEARADGIVAVNTTVSRAGLATPTARLERLGEGGISGGPLRQRAREVVGRIYNRTGGTIPIIGVGGVFSADDAWALVRSGASLVQLYTGFVYGGPGVLERINRGLLHRLQASGLAELRQAVGTAAT